MGRAERSSDRVACHAGNGGLRIGDKFAVLHVEASDFGEWVADELRDDGEDFGSVNGQARTVEAGIAHAVGVEIAAVGIACPGVTRAGICTAASITAAHGLACRLAGVGRDSRRDRVGFPNVHLSTARTVATDTSVLIIGGRLPAIDISLNVGPSVSRAAR